MEQSSPWEPNITSIIQEILGAPHGLRTAKKSGGGGLSVIVFCIL